MPILYINKSDSHCECSYKGVRPMARLCPYCGVEWDTVSSMYTGMGIERQIMAMRPDLEPYFPWSDFWESEEGQMTLSELRVQLQMDTKQEEE